MARSRPRVRFLSATLRRLLPSLLLMLAMAACTKRPRGPEVMVPEEEAGGYPAAAAAEAPDHGGARSVAKAAGRSRSPYLEASEDAGAESWDAPAAAPIPAPAPTQASPAEPPATPASPPARPAARRMVHYSGWASLRSTEPVKVIDSAIALVTAAGGYLEERRQDFALLRVPAGRFDTVFTRVQRLADVIDHGQEAEDITAAYQDTELRLRIVAATIERLEALVKTAKTEAQKLRLLRELKQQREEREVLEARRKDLAGRARFASIRLHVQGHVPDLIENAWRKDFRDFRWIHSLSPFDDRRFQGRGTLAFPAPEGMVVSRKRRPWRATGSQGAEFWGSRRKVGPRGDSRFWSEAIRVRLKDGFKAADTLEMGGFRFCRFQSHGPTPYYYWVGVRSLGGKVEIAELYFPDGGQEERHLPALRASLERRKG